MGGGNDVRFPGATSPRDGTPEGDRLDPDPAHGEIDQILDRRFGDPEATLLLLGLGLRSFSMSPYHLPVVKKVIAGVAVPEACRVAEEALALGSTTEVRALLRRHTLRYAPELAAWLQPEL